MGAAESKDVQQGQGQAQGQRQGTGMGTGMSSGPTALDNSSRGDSSDEAFKYESSEGSV